MATVAFEHLDINAEPGGGVAPIESELAALQDEDFVAARQHVGECGFPRAVTVGDIDVRAPFGTEQTAEVA